MEVPVQVFAADIAQQPYDATPAEISHLISLGDGTLIRLGPDGAALPDLLAGWRSLQTTYVTFFDCLTAALRASMSPKSRFLALVLRWKDFTRPSMVTTRSRGRNSRSSARTYFAGSSNSTALI